MFDIFSLLQMVPIDNDSYGGDMTDNALGNTELTVSQEHALFQGDHGDWDNDGVPNYADHWFGPGASNPGSSLGSVRADEIPDWTNDNHGYLHHDSKTLGDAANSMNHDYDPDPGIIGTPMEEVSYWSVQQDDYSCAIASQRAVLESITGLDVCEQELSSIALSEGWYDPSSGTSPENVGRLLEYYGVPVQRSFDLNITDIADALNRGDKVIVALDANEIWHPASDAYGNPVEQSDAGHAVWLTGLIYNNDGSIDVVLNDTGISNGAFETIPLEHFENAWNDYGNFAVITDSNGGGL